MRLRVVPPCPSSAGAREDPRGAVCQEGGPRQVVGGEQGAQAQPGGAESREGCEHVFMVHRRLLLWVGQEAGR